MIKNYFKIAWRNLIKNKGFALINLLGLATGFTVCLLIVMYARYEFSYENTNSNADRIIRLTTDRMDGESITAQDCETYPPIGPKIKSELPDVENFTRAYQVGEPSVNVRVGDKNNLIDRVYAVDTSYFSIFTSHFINGTPEKIFARPGEAVLTKSTALKYFNRTDVVGETIEMQFGKGPTLLKVVAVVEDGPSNTHLKFDMLISYATLLSDPVLQSEYGEKEDNWNGNNTFTYVLLNKQAGYSHFTKSLAGFSKRLIDEKKIKQTRFIGQKIGDIHLYSKKTFEPEPNGDATSVYFLLAVALLIIISAFVNYINLATSKALDRAKEVGIRKVVGSTKHQLKIQFLIESLVMNLLAGALAVLISWFLKSKFITLSGLPEGIDIYQNMFFWEMLISFIITGVFLSGLYPAFVLSSFKPSLVLKGSFSHSTRGILLRKSLVVVQFTITVILLIQIFTVSEQLSYLRSIDLGVNTNNTIVVKAPAENGSREKYDAFKQALLAKANIKSVSVSGCVPGQMAGQMSTTTGINLSEKISENNYNFYLTDIDADYIPVMGMKLKAGNNFDKTSSIDKKEVIVNEEALRLWGIQDAEKAVGRKLNFWGSDWTIRGVLKNYYQESAKSAFIPIIHKFSNYFGSYASIKFLNNNPKEQIAQVQETYKSIFPATAFSYFFMDKAYNMQYKSDERFQSVFAVLTGFSILIACLGLFGLALFMVSKRRKEIGIRKVIGASVINILVLLSNSFIKTVLISIIIGIPVTYIIAKKWLANFANRIELSWWLFALPVLLILLLVIFTVCINTIRTAVANPVKSLRTE
ncbi:MAG: ABC transporter permease [Ferruginibacter sp.]